MAEKKKKDEEAGGEDSALAKAAKAVGSAVGKAAAKVGIAAKPKENLYQAEYQGSGTFKVTKPKRKTKKRRQTKLKGHSRGARG